MLSYSSNASHGSRDGAPRSICWSTAMQLPHNGTAFNILNLRRVPVATLDGIVDNVHKLCPSTRERRCVTRLLSCLLQHDARLEDVAFVPYTCVAMSRGFPTNPLCCCEAALSFFVNYTSDWLKEWPKPPHALLQTLDAWLRHHCEGLWHHLNGSVPECTYLNYIWLPLQTLLLHSLSPMAWLPVFDDAICRADAVQYFYALPLALCVQLQPFLMHCGDVDAVHRVLTSPELVEEPKKLQLQAARIACKMRVDIPPAQNLGPVDAQYYPTLIIGEEVQPVVEVESHTKLIEHVLRSEKELQRREHNFHVGVEAADDISRFYSALAADDPSDFGVGGAAGADAQSPFKDYTAPTEIPSHADATTAVRYSSAAHEPLAEHQQEQGQQRSAAGSSGRERASDIASSIGRGCSANYHSPSTFDVDDTGRNNASGIMHTRGTSIPQRQQDGSDDEHDAAAGERHEETIDRSAAHHQQHAQECERAPSSHGSSILPPHVKEAAALLYASQLMSANSSGIEKQPQQVQPMYAHDATVTGASSSVRGSTFGPTRSSVTEKTGLDGTL